MTRYCVIGTKVNSVTYYKTFEIQQKISVAMSVSGVLMEAVTVRSCAIPNNSYLNEFERKSGLSIARPPNHEVPFYFCHVRFLELTVAAE